MQDHVITFAQLAAAAGYSAGPDGKLNLPATQETADALAREAERALPPWKPGQPGVCVTLTGAGPVWGHLAIAHALHGRVCRLTYAAPNTPGIVVFSHGV